MYISNPKKNLLMLKLFVFSFFYCKHLLAAMYVYPMEVSIGENGSSQIKLISQDDSVQFIRVSLKQVHDPGTKQEYETAIDDADSTALVITPQKVALSSGSERIVRLVSVIPQEKETTWRAYFESVNEDNFITQDIKSGDSKNAASIGVNVVWGALIHVAPEHVVPSLRFNMRNGMVENNGTIRIPVKELGTCGQDGKCKWKKTAITIYPDTAISIPGVTFSSGLSYRVRYVNWLSNKMEEIPLPVKKAN